MGNVLETVTIPAYPVIEEIKDCKDQWFKCDSACRLYDP